MLLAIAPSAYQGDAVHALSGGEKYFRAFDSGFSCKRGAQNAHGCAPVEKSMIVNLNPSALSSKQPKRAVTRT